MAKVACGGSHTIVLCQNGQIFSFGLSTNGQLGLGTQIQETCHPTEIISPLLADKKVTEICCGENHTALITDSGQLFTFGDGRHGKLCLDFETITNYYQPALSKRFNGFQVRGVYCGGCHTMVFAVPIPGYKESNNNEKGKIMIKSALVDFIKFFT